MELLPLIVQGIAGLVGGNVVGALVSRLSAGGLWGSLAGVVGGVLAGQVLTMPGLTDADGADLSALVADIGTGAAGGAALAALVGLLRGALSR